MPNPAAIAQAIRDPLGTVLHLLTSVLGHVLAAAHVDLDSVLQRYLFTTADPSSPQPRAFTANPAVAHLHLGMAVAADLLVAVVIIGVSLHAMLQRSVISRAGMKAAWPRVLLAVALVHGSLFLIQLALDLNNAIGHVALSLGPAIGIDDLPWSSSTGEAAAAGIQATQDLFHALFALSLVVALVILALSYVVRTALLDILVVIAPLAALSIVLPETRRYARTWMHIFLTTVFMQAVQLIVLRVAATTQFATGTGLVPMLYALATLWIMLKVPSVLHSSGYFETRAHAVGRHLQRSVRHAAMPAHHPARSRALP